VDNGVERPQVESIELIVFHVTNKVLVGRILEGICGEKVRIIDHPVFQIDGGTTVPTHPESMAGEEPGPYAITGLFFELLLTELVEFPDFPDCGGPFHEGNWLLCVNATVVAVRGRIGTTEPGQLPGFDVVTRRGD